MERQELKEIIQRVIKKATESKGKAPKPASIWADDSPPYDGPTTRYAIGEEG